VNYRKRFYSGTIEARGGFTYDKDFDIHGDRFGQSTFRSYILANGKFDIDEKWKWGFTAERVSDALLFDKYKINDVYVQRGLFTSDDHRLVSQLFATRQDQRSWFSVSAVSVQGLRVVGINPTTNSANAFENSGAFPLIGPLVEARWEPDSPVLGGRLRLQGSGVMLNRSESQYGEPPYYLPDYKGQSGVDSSRASFKADWRYQHHRRQRPEDLAVRPGARRRLFDQVLCQPRRRGPGRRQQGHLHPRPGRRRRRLQPAVLQAVEERRQYCAGAPGPGRRRLGQLARAHRRRPQRDDDLPLQRRQRDAGVRRDQPVPGQQVAGLRPL
jgi:hypothetical protein